MTERELEIPSTTEGYRQRAEDLVRRADQTDDMKEKADLLNEAFGLMVAAHEKTHDPR